MRDTTQNRRGHVAPGTPISTGESRHAGEDIVAPSPRRRRPDGRRPRRLVAALAALIGVVVAGMMFAAPAQATTSTNKLANAYGLVSDAGTAVLTIPFRNGTGLTYDGTVWFWTSPGAVGTSVSYTDSGAVVRSTTGTDGQTLPAFAATSDGSTEQIGTWTIPTGESFSTSEDAAQKQVTLQLDAAHLDYAGPIRPLKVSLTDTSNQSYLNVYFYTGTGTMYAFTTATTNDSTFPVTTATGTATTDYTVGSCMNTSSTPNAYSGELYNGTCTGSTVSLVDADGNDVTSLDLLDTAGNVIGTWNVNGTDITWTVTSSFGVLGIQPVDYRVEDTRASGWAGWYDQSLTGEANILGGTVSYDIATLTPTTSLTAATAADASVSTDPETSVTLAPVYGAGDFVFGDAAEVTDVTVDPSDGSQGEWVVNDDGTVSFTPAEGVAGTTASATYTVTSSNGTTASATLTVTIAAAPVAATPATAEDASASTDPVTPVTLSLVYGPGTEVGGAAATVESVTVDPSDASQGEWAVNADGTATFTPAAGVSGTTASATYTVTSSNGTTALATLTVTIAATVIPPDDTPAQNDTSGGGTPSSETSTAAVLAATGASGYGQALLAAAVLVIAGLCLRVVRRRRS